MEMLFDRNYKLLKINRPYINMEETNYSFIIYQNEGPYYGLYDNKRGGSLCDSGRNHLITAYKVN